MSVSATMPRPIASRTPPARGSCLRDESVRNAGLRSRTAGAGCCSRRSDDDRASPRRRSRSARCSARSSPGRSCRRTLARASSATPTPPCFAACRNCWSSTSSISAARRCVSDFGQLFGVAGFVGLPPFVVGRARRRRDFRRLSGGGLSRRVPRGRRPARSRPRAPSAWDGCCAFAASSRRKCCALPCPASAMSGSSASRIRRWSPSPGLPSCMRMSQWRRDPPISISSSTSPARRSISSMTAGLEPHFRRRRSAGRQELPRTASGEGERAWTSPSSSRRWRSCFAVPAIDAARSGPLSITHRRRAGARHRLDAGEPARRCSSASRAPTSSCSAARRC